MSLYAIGDLHLSLKAGSTKQMDCFGGAWVGYVDRIKSGFSKLNSDDITLLCGDLSWGMNLDDALEDFKFINALPGRKILLKGNHDYWWTTVTKMKSFFVNNNLNSFDILYNSSFLFGDTALCGTRGWFLDENAPDGSPDRKVFAREIGRLRASLSAARSHNIICFLHYPPVYRDYRCAEIIDVLSEFGVDRCYYAHLHGSGHLGATQGRHSGIDFTLISADYVGFCPVKILD